MAKIVGTAICLAGAASMAFFKGPALLGAGLGPFPSRRCGWGGRRDGGSRTGGRGGGVNNFFFFFCNLAFLDFIFTN